MKRIHQTTQEPHVYIYLDRQGVESLFAQTVEKLETEFASSVEKGKEGKVGAKMGIGQALGILLGLASVDLDTEIALSGKRVDEIKSQLTTEHKLVRLLEYLNALKGDKFFDDLVEATLKCSESGESVFVCVRESFDAPQFMRRGGGALAAVNKAKGVFFQIHRPEFQVMMTASLAKFTRLPGETMHLASHEATIWREYGGKHIPLHVFGHMVYAAGYHHIKPYAIRM